MGRRLIHKEGVRSTILVAIAAALATIALLVVSSGNSALAASSPVNGNFETGDLTGWSVDATGSGETASAVTGYTVSDPFQYCEWDCPLNYLYVSPHEGSYFALLKVADQSQWTTISQPFTASNGDRISGWVFTLETLYQTRGFTTPGFEDKGQVVLTDGLGTTVATLFKDTGSSGDYNSPWRYWEYNFTDLPGEGQFQIQAKQSSQMWSWEPNVLGLDDVKVSTVSAAPSPPTITSPQSNTYDNDGSFSVSGSAERGSTVELVEGAISKGTTKADPSTGAWSIALSKVSDGVHTYTAKATNVAGTSNASSPVSITVDSVKPSAPKVTGPADYSYDTDGNITFGGYAEKGSPVKVYQDGATTAGGQDKASTTATDPAGGWWSIYLTGVSEQSTAHTFDFTATDAAGNESAKTTVHVTVNDSPPTITSPQNNTYYSDGSFSVSGSAEAGSTVELFEDTTSREFEGGVLVHTLSSTVESRGTTKADSSSGAWSIALSGVSEGPHTYFAKATGAGGNTSSASNSVKVSVEKAAPTVSDVYPADGATRADRQISIGASFSEPMDPATFTTSTVTLVKEGTTTPISARVGYYESNGYYKVWLSPPYEQGFYLDANTKYTVKIKGGTNGVKDLAGHQLSGGNQASGDYWWSFTTGTQPAPSCTKTGTANAETISGTSGADVICAGGGNDTVKGLGGNDTLLGEGGADTLLGGVGDDTLDGGSGTDTASYSASLTAVTASLATNFSTGEGSDTFLGVENLLGSSIADSLTGSAANNKLTGGGGPDTLKGEDGDDAVDSKDGVKGNDSLDGGGGTDTKVTDATEKSIVNFP
jgi:hypothetical protein